MISSSNEIEVKLDATHIKVKDFKKYILKHPGYEGKLDVIGPDYYWRQGENNVVRHRVDRKNGKHELTVKKRESKDSIRSRLEIDLKMDENTSIEDVCKFLRATGYEKVFTLVKRANIYWVRLSGDLVSTFVLYTVWDQDEDGNRSKIKRFCEIEAEKGSNVSPETAKKHIENQMKILQKKFHLGEPLNKSLYEIYSNQSYGIVKES